jgi:hypothetical protein
MMPVLKKLKALVHAPRYAAAMQEVYRAGESENWARVVEIVERLHQRGMITSTSRHWLGIAFLKLGRPQDALDQYERIEGPLGDQGSEARRILNHALSHYRVGNPARCAAMLKDSIDADWPDVELRKAKSILREIEAEH